VTRVLCLCSRLGVGGAERQLSLLLPELRARGYDPYVVALREQGIYFEALEYDHGQMSQGSPARTNSGA
jgi:hypothetical protein